MGRKALPNPTRRPKNSPPPSAEEVEATNRALTSVNRLIAALEGAEPTKTTPAERAMQEIGKTILRMEMKRAGVGYAGLAELLNKMGIPENEPNVRNKIARGTFAMSYFIACLRALETKSISLDIEVPKARAILACGQGRDHGAGGESA